MSGSLAGVAGFRVLPSMRFEYFLSLPKNDRPPDLRNLSGRFEDVLRP